MLYQNGEILKADNCYVWTYYDQELRMMLAASSVDILKFKIDTFLSFNKNILSKAENLDNKKLLLNVGSTKLKDFTGGEGEIMPPKYKVLNVDLENTNTEIRYKNLDSYKYLENSQREELLTTLPIILNEKELSKMSKQFKKNYTLNGLIVRIRITKSGVYELRYRRNGYNIAVSHKQLEVAKAKFKEALFSPYTKKAEPKKIAPKAVEPTAYKYTEGWLETAKKPYIAENTYRNYEKYLSTNLKPFFEERKLSSFTLSELQAFINQYVNEGKCRTAQGLRIMLREIFKYAKFDKLVDDNPAEGLRPIIYEQKHGAALTIAQDIALAEKIYKSDLESKNALLLLLCTGMRPVELQNTTIDLEKGYLRIVSAKQRKGYTKTVRNIPITPRAKRLIDFSANLQFCSKRLQLDIKKIDPNIIPYDMRHTFITNAQECGVPREVVACWVGHSPGKSMTGKVYTHFSDEYMLEQSQKINY